MATTTGNGAAKKDREYTVFTALRITPAQLARVLKIQEAETDKLQYPITKTSVIRKLLTLGLDKWDAEHGGRR